MAVVTAIDLKNWGVPFASSTGRVWPVPEATKAVSYTLTTGKVVGNGATCFHASREDSKRWHAGMDLPCFPGNRVVAMEDGIVMGMISGFVKLGAVVVMHAQCVAVYAEIDLNSLTKAGLKPGSSVIAGQLIGFGALNYEENSMLHLEIWSKSNPPKFYTPWYVGSPAPVGLMDPSMYLLNLSLGVAPQTESSVGSGSSKIIATTALAYVGYRLARWLS